MATRLTFGIADNSNELGRFSVPIADATDGATFVAASDAQGDFALIIAALSLGILQTQNIGVTDQLSTTRPTDPYALRETAVRFVMADADGNQVVASLPAPDLDKFPFAAIGQDTTPVPYAGVHADVTLMITALETEVVHPISGLGVTVIRLDFVGRNN